MLWILLYINVIGDYIINLFLKVNKWLIRLRFMFFKFFKNIFVSTKKFNYFKRRYNLFYCYYGLNYIYFLFDSLFNKLFYSNIRFNILFNYLLN